MEGNMDNNRQSTHIGLLVLVGAVWGLSEVVLGIGLNACARLVSGSIMTGAALFFVATGFALSKKLWSVAFLILIASSLKLFDAGLLSLPVKHGAVANPIFAFVLTGLMFLVMISIFTTARLQSTKNRALLGGLTAHSAAQLFPLVRFATGIPACVLVGTSLPLSVVFAPLAVLVSAIAAPLGFQAGDRMRKWQGARVEYLASPAALILSLVILVFIRSL
jgi:hypothetical protein